MIRNWAGHTHITVRGNLSRPKMSRRIYARRAALTGLLIAATFIFFILQTRAGTSMAIPITGLAIAFATMFAAPVAEATARQSIIKLPTKAAGRWLTFFILLAGSPILAPLALVFSTVQFLRSAT
ncbi:hypothetical protein HBA92_19580 [Ochrobactrum sp. MR28]|uniref:hypothetical protein n=1 Tax=Pseudochrobactrum asaccharolyticum TaxID=354351 RepID=UPI004041835B|nr:hypothetical protein [Ochrobactrum sp. MR28]MBX8818493.1 hypothetical protein [Ochrobactrum sp. MR31]